jgi:methyltransferase (TIGR00027 family)
MLKKRKTSLAVYSLARPPARQANSPPAFSFRRQNKQKDRRLYMEEGRPSATAMVAAMMRAAHLLWDGEPKILEDDLALGLSGVESEAALRAALNALQTELTQRFPLTLVQSLLQYTRAGVTLRSRYAEDELAKAIERGVSQYVILGAGLDSFAYRRRDLAGVLRVLEVDHPATQHWKQVRLQELRVDLPPHLTFIPLDFERQTIVEALSAGGYHPEEPAFFSWLGVTWFLTEETIYQTLHLIASTALGSEIVFEYPIAEALLEEEERQMLAIIKALGVARGEPVRSLFEPARLMTRAQELGFGRVWDFGPEEANPRYFAGRSDGLQFSKIGRLLKARVGAPLR